MIAGHETPTAGQIYIGDQMVVGKSPVERGTAMMFQSYALFPHLTIADNVGFYLKMRGVGKEERRERVDGDAEAGPARAVPEPHAGRSFPAASSSASRSPAR